MTDIPGAFLHWGIFIDKIHEWVYNRILYL